MAEDNLFGINWLQSKETYNSQLEEVVRDRDTIREESNNSSDFFEISEISARPTVTEVWTSSHQLEAAQDTSAQPKMQLQPKLQQSSEFQTILSESQRLTDEVDHAHQDGQVVRQKKMRKRSSRGGEWRL